MRIRTKTTLITVLLVLFLGFTVLVVSRTILQRELETEYAKRSLSIAGHTAADIIDPLLTNDEFKMKQILEDVMVNEKDIKYIFVIDLEGKAVVHTYKSGFPSGLLNANRVPEGLIISEQLLETEQGLIHDIGYRLLSGSSAELHLGVDQGAVSSAVSGITRSVGLAIFLAVSISALIMLYLSHLITSPLEKLERAVNGFTRWRLNEDLDIYTNDEVGKLAAVFKKMASELKTSFSKLKESEDKYRTLSQNASEAVFVHTLEGKILEVNHKATRLTGYSRFELEKMTIQELFRENSDKLFDYLKKAPRRAGLHVDTKLLTKSKGYVEVEISAGKAHYGGETVIQSLVFDISERKKLEDTLRKNRDYLNTIWNYNRAAIVIIDEATHTLVDANPVALELIGLPQEKVIGQVCHSYICPAAVGSCPISDLGQEIDNAERTLIKADGTSIPILKTVVPLELYGRKALLESFVDISELKETEAQLREEKETKEKLARQVLQSHENERKKLSGEIHDSLIPQVAALSTWMNAILADKPPIEAKTRLKFQKTFDVIQNIINTSRAITSGLRPPLLEPGGLSYSVREFVKRSCAENDVEAVFDIRKLPEIDEDVRLTAFRVVQEAVSNALKHGRPGKIKISLASHNDSLLVRVKDNGEGFDPALRKEDAATGEHLGLSVMAERVEMAGGALDVVSEKGKGTTIKASFPLKNREKAMII